MGAAEQWQERVVKGLEGTDWDVLNPRRDDWDSTWVQSIEHAQFREQVEWELRGIEGAHAVLVYFAPDTKAPITLLELGILTKDPRKVIVVCPPDFYRKGNVDVVCARYEIKQMATLEEAVAFLKEKGTLV